MTARRLASICWLLVLTGCAAEPRQQLSVVLISPDSLRADRLRPWNPEGPPTPNLERLAARGTVFRNSWSTSPWTAPSMVSVMTGLYPPSHGVAYRDDTTPAALPTLPRLLAAAGYEIGNFSFFSQISYFRNLGLGEVEKGLGHARVAGSFRAWLAGLPPEQPFFGWVHLLETHLPYGASGYRATEVTVPGSTGLERAQLDAVIPVGSVEFVDGDRRRLLELYDRDVREMDRVLGRVLDALEEHGRVESTVVIYVADHGEELLEHGWVGHASTSIEAKLVPEILRVPLLFAGPGVVAGGVRDELVQQVDILPTVLRLLGLEPPSETDGLVLPVFEGWRGWFQGTERASAFFDSSPGGNLTPQEKRGERLQGITDGECLLTTRIYPDRPEDSHTLAAGQAAQSCTGEVTERLRAELQEWRRQQAEQRLAVLARYPDGSAPASAEVDGYTEAIEVARPRPGDRLSWQQGGGQVTFEWAGSGRSYWIEYLLGRPPPADPRQLSAGATARRLRAGAARLLERPRHLQPVTHPGGRRGQPATVEVDRVRGSFGRIVFHPCYAFFAMPHGNSSPSRFATLGDVPGTELRQLQATFGSFREFVERYSPWLSDSCIFVETLERIPVGAYVRLEIGLRDRPVLIRALGQVDWVREAGEDEDEGPAGAALKITYLDPASARLIESVFRRYIDQTGAVIGKDVPVDCRIDDAGLPGPAASSDPRVEETPEPPVAAEPPVAVKPAAAIEPAPPGPAQGSPPAAPAAAPAGTLEEELSELSEVFSGLDVGAVSHGSSSGTGLVDSPSPAATAAAAAAAPPLPGSRPPLAGAARADSADDKGASFLRWSVLLFLLAIIVVAVIFAVLRNRQGDDPEMPIPGPASENLKIEADATRATGR